MSLIARLEIILIVVISLQNSSIAQDLRFKASATGKSEYLAVKSAYVRLFDKVLQNLVGDQAARAIGKEFKTLIKRDFSNNKNKFFVDEYKKCLYLPDLKVRCTIKASAELITFKTEINYIQTRIGSGNDYIGGYRLAILYRNNNRLSRILARKLQKKLKTEYGHKVDQLLESGSWVGLNKPCNALRQQIKRYRRQGFQEALTVAREKLNTVCKANAGINYVIEIKRIDFSPELYRNGFIDGTLELELILKDAQTNQISNSFDINRISTSSDLIKGYGSSKKLATDNLEDALLQAASDKISKQANNIFNDYARTHGEQKNNLAIKNYPYIYTLILKDITEDAFDMPKINAMCNVIKQSLGLTIKKNIFISDEYNHYYQFGSQYEVVMDDLKTRFYNTARKAGYSLRIRTQENNTLVISFEN